MTYSVLKARAVRGHDGNGFEATLAENGKAVATVFDDGWGGSLQFTWADRQLPYVEVEIIGYQDKPMTIKCSPAEARLQAHVRALPPIENDLFDDGESHPMRQDLDSFVSTLVEDELETRRIRALLKRRTVVLVGKAVYELSGAPLTELPLRTRAELAMKHPGAEPVVLNALPEGAAIERYLAAAR
jgi:hypothetical protein